MSLAQLVVRVVGWDAPGALPWRRWGAARIDRPGRSETSDRLAHQATHVSSASSAWTHRILLSRRFDLFLYLASVSPSIPVDIGCALSPELIFHPK